MPMFPYQISGMHELHLKTRWLAAALRVRLVTFSESGVGEVVEAGVVQGEDGYTVYVNIAEPGADDLAMIFLIQILDMGKEARAPLPDRRPEHESLLRFWPCVTETIREMGYRNEGRPLRD